MNEPVVISGVGYILDKENHTANVVRLQTGIITIPPSFDYNGLTYSVTTISHFVEVIPTSVLSLRESIQELRIIGEGLVVQERAFYRISNLGEVVIEGHLKRIGDAAFAYCSALKSVIISARVDTVGNNIFSGCGHLEEAYIGDGINSFGKSIFRNCANLKKVRLPESLSTIPEATFIGCSSLNSLIIPDNVVTIGKYAFLDCASLPHLTYDVSRVTLEYGCFNRTPLDPTWYKTHPSSTKQESLYSKLYDVKNNLQKGIVLCASRSIYDTSGYLLKGDELLNVIMDYSNGTSIHFPISDLAKNNLIYRDFSDSGRRVYFFPTGSIYRRVICGGSESAHFIRMVEKGNPLGKSIRNTLTKDGVKMEYLDHPELWMADYLERNPDIPGLISDALKGVGFDYDKDSVKNLAMKRIRTDESWDDSKLNYWDNNFLCQLVLCIHCLYMSIDKLYKSRGYIRGKEFYEQSILSYIFLINLTKFHTMSYELLPLDKLKEINSAL